MLQNGESNLVVVVIVATTEKLSLSLVFVFDEIEASKLDENTHTNREDRGLMYSRQLVLTLCFSSKIESYAVLSELLHRPRAS